MKLEGELKGDFVIKLFNKFRKINSALYLMHPRSLNIFIFDKKKYMLHVYQM